MYTYYITPKTFDSFQQHNKFAFIFTLAPKISFNLYNKYIIKWTLLETSVSFCRSSMCFLSVTGSRHFSVSTDNKIVVQIAIASQTKILLDLQPFIDMMMHVPNLMLTSDKSIETGFNLKAHLTCVDVRMWFDWPEDPVVDSAGGKPKSEGSIPFTAISAVAVELPSSRAVNPTVYCLHPADGCSE